MAPVSIGAPDRRMYAPHMRREESAGPGPTGLVNGTGNDNAHIAFDSDCFSHDTASTRRWMPPEISDAATLAVDLPTDPAVHPDQVVYPRHQVIRP